MEWERALLHKNLARRFQYQYIFIYQSSIEVDVEIFPNNYLSHEVTLGEGNTNIIVGFDMTVSIV